MARQSLRVSQGKAQTKGKATEGAANFGRAIGAAFSPNQAPRAKAFKNGGVAKTRKKR